MDWFRSHHGAPTDPKWLLIAKRAGVRPIHVAGTWWALLDHASQHSERGRVDDFDVETFALFAGMEEAAVNAIVSALCACDMIVDGRVVYRWHLSRQSLPVTTCRQVAARCDYRCTYCGDLTGPFEVDHIYPVALGGTDDLENLTLACVPCNRSKGAKKLSEWNR